jgi:hypothetical protein
VDESHQVAVKQCGLCNKGTVIIEPGSRPGPSLFTGEAPVMWWPTPNAAEQIDSDAGLPKKALDAYGEGLRCIAARAPNAAAGRFRTRLGLVRCCTSLLYEVTPQCQ